MTTAARKRIPRNLAKRKGYHHGNLKEALLDVARKLIAERGPLGFTLVDAARLAGVSAAAPYRHFRDRNALLAEVRRRGFVAFGQRLTSAWESAPADPANAFRRMGSAYLAFAREEPGYYSAMFTASPSLPRAAAKAEADAAFGRLLQSIERVMPVSGEGKRGLPMLAFQVWALSHGVATLATAGQIPREAGIDPQAALTLGVNALLRGTGAAAPR